MAKLNWQRPRVFETNEELGSESTPLSRRPFGFPEQIDNVFLNMAALGQGVLFSQIFKPKTTACRKVSMKGITCTFERKKRRKQRQAHPPIS